MVAETPADAIRRSTTGSEQEHRHWLDDRAWNSREFSVVLGAIATSEKRNHQKGFATHGPPLSS